MNLCHRGAGSTSRHLLRLKSKKERGQLIHAIVYLSRRSHKPINIALPLVAGVTASAAACAHAAGAAAAAARDRFILASGDSLLPCREMVSGAQLSLQPPARNRSSNGAAQLQREMRNIIKFCMRLHNPVRRARCRQTLRHSPVVYAVPGKVQLEQKKTAWGSRDTR